VELPEKDWPILGGAIAAEATHLITGDLKHFGRYFGPHIHGILVLPLPITSAPQLALSNAGLYRPLDAVPFR